MPFVRDSIGSAGHLSNVTCLDCVIDFKSISRHSLGLCPHIYDFSRVFLSWLDEDDMEIIAIQQWISSSVIEHRSGKSKQQKSIPIDGIELFSPYWWRVSSIIFHCPVDYFFLLLDDFSSKHVKAFRSLPLLAISKYYNRWTSKNCILDQRFFFKFGVLVWTLIWAIGRFSRLPKFGWYCISAADMKSPKFLDSLKIHNYTYILQIIRTVVWNRIEFRCYRCYSSFLKYYICSTEINLI